VAVRVATRRSVVPDKPRPMSEAEFQREVVRLARSLLWGVTIQAWKRDNDDLSAYGQPPEPLAGLVFHPRFSVGSEPGWPDLVLIRRRDKRVLFRELKSDTGVVHPRQAAVLELMTACGLDAAVWRPSDLTRIGEELL
jgi:VRR-NUC domain